MSGLVCDQLPLPDLRADCLRERLRSPDVHTFTDSAQDSAGKHIQLGPIGPDVPIPSVGDPRTNIGPFVLAILQQPERTLNGRFVLAVTEQGSMNKFLAAWSQVTGKSSQFVQCAMEDYERLWPGWGKVEGDMLRFYNEFGGQVAGSEKEILMASDLDVDLTRSMGVVDSMRRAIEKS